ncbi:hypothetical protein BKA67DRAFT_558521 [Truncatella angustata]|uniref:F-box domain-containing protein n=1 Tax=Truncatella angustata TaxID=152316 RepID=A0A9P8UUK6_9PEZI|nr:uncharacterized protein BKA67DRAFT_558521 [Truncatella angustata]KAH6658601.1 hypothetical protein BKA67DRAFT_558521 [Truncatella angustata]
MKPTLCSLPLEVFLMIFNELPALDIQTFRSVNKHLSYFATQSIFKYVTVTPNELSILSLALRQAVYSLNIQFNMPKREKSIRSHTFRHTDRLRRFQQQLDPQKWPALNHLHFSENQYQRKRNKSIPQFFRYAVHSLGKRANHIKKLSFGEPEKVGWGICKLLANLRNPHAIERAFSHVEELCLALPQAHDATNKLFEGISVLIRSLPALEKLLISGEEFEAPTGVYFPDEFCLNISVPRLKALSLCSVRFRNHNGLVNLSKNHKTTLKTLKLEEVGLETGSWEEAIVDMRCCLELKVCSVVSPLELWMNGDYAVLDQCGRTFEASLASFLLKKSDENPFLNEEIVGFREHQGSIAETFHE